MAQGSEAKGAWRGTGLEVSEQLSGFLSASSKVLKLLVQCLQPSQKPALGFVLSFKLTVGSVTPSWFYSTHLTSTSHTLGPWMQDSGAML